MVLIGELQVGRGLIPPLPHIPSWGPIIPPYDPEYMLVPPSLAGGWGLYAQIQGPSQDLRYTPGASSGTGPSTDPFTSNDDDDDANQFISDSFRDNDSQ